MRIKPGTVVLVNFPFTDLQSSKVRPAIALTQKGGDVIIVGIFSKVPEDLQDSWIRLDEGDPGFKQTGLRKASVIKTQKNCGGPSISHPKRTWPPFSGAHTKSKTNTPSNSWN
jgi:hypothetical protein